MGSFVRYVYCSLQFWISLGQHLLELRNFILLILSYLFSRYFVFVIFFAYLSPQSWRHCSRWGYIRSLFSTRWFWVFVCGGAVLSFFAWLDLLRRRVLQPSVFWCVDGRFAINWLWGPRWPIGPCIYTVVCVFSLSSVGKIRLHYLQNISDV